MNLWTADQNALQRGLQWIPPYFDASSSRTHQQLEPFARSSAALLLNLAPQGLDESRNLIAHVKEHPWQSMTFSKADLTGRKHPVSQS